MKLCISNLGLDIKRPEQPGPCLEGHVRLAETLYENETNYCNGRLNCLNLILLDPLTASDIARMAKSEDHIIHARIINNVFSEKVIPRNAVSKIRALTQMEKVVLSLQAENYTYTQIADILKVDKETSKSHIYNIRKKTGLRTKLQAANAFIIFKAIYPDWRNELKESLRVYCH